ncbi:PepSY domain-containing protein [Lysobacter spongiicola]|uniref:Peptidase propeptide and YPEB domain-containing protein n=1 Tax=Lysobacter spongiicola DSM 21749 TaxID=1122188 RepID=A0A1T4PJQ1_9GAMM|nr:hypothetical protein SAMN02745674_01229 [Lysobacter spongiicola DSM 21749]
MQIQAVPVALSVAAIVVTLSMGGDAWAAQASREPARQSQRDLVERDESRHAKRGSDHRALSDAVRRVERRSGGQVLSAERVPYDGRNINRVKVVDASGRVRVYVDDPAARRPVRPVPTRDKDN